MNHTVKLLLAHVARIAALVAALAATSCATTPRSADPPARRAKPDQARSAAPAVQALRAGRFDEALGLADTVLTRDADNARVNVVAAIVRYKRAMDPLGRSALGLLSGRRGGVSERAVALREAMARTAKALGRVERHLARAAPYRDFSLELCIACWRVDWNHDGRINYRDARIFAIERDANGQRIAPDDPRRRPTFRFDVGDIYWARAFVAFSRAALDLALAYDWRDIETIVRHARRRGELRIPLVDKGRVIGARAHVLAGLRHSDAARRAYLAETDDRREWLPNPRQKDHPLPLPVDAALYETWRGVLVDLTALVEGKTGLGVRDVAATLFGRRGRWAKRLGRLPDSFIDIARMFREPGDLVIDLHHVRPRAFLRNPELALRATFGAALRTGMARSGLGQRLSRVQQQLLRGESTLGRKLRYLLWIN
ncbi:MAG: hypothetical protein KC503_35240 [Myxococcales bacterium]|nr:hypothetical protein [Myxococcales bacterium]